MIARKQPARQSGADHWTRRNPAAVLRGPAAAGAKLTEEEIREICALYRAHQPRRTWLARKFKVSRQTIHRHLNAAGLIGDKRCYT